MVVIITGAYDVLGTGLKALLNLISLNSYKSPQNRDIIFILQIRKFGLREVK